MEVVSIIVPVYNAEQLLNRCIRSILNQSYTNIELILVDDGSTDSSPKICDLWKGKDSRVKVHHQKNRGVSGARNAGIQLATGEYVMMVDSDDYLAFQCVELLYSAATVSGAHLVVCDFEEGEDKEFPFELNSLSDAIKMVSSEIALLNSYENDHSALRYIAPWGKLYHRSLFEGIVYPEGLIFEDIYVTHKLITISEKIAVIDNKLLYYYQHPDSIMHARFHPQKLDYLGALYERINYYQEHHFEKLAEIAYDEYLHSLIWEYSRTRDILHSKTLMKEIWRHFKSVYVRYYASKRYPKENRVFLFAFNCNPELIIWYWKISAKLKR